MDGRQYEAFFLDPQDPSHRRYEALRGVFVDEVRLNVDLDTVLTVLANGCYRWLANQLHGFANAKPKQLYRKFVETSGTVEIESGRRIVVSFDRRAHNPILREALLDKDCPPIPWLGNRRLEFVFA
jgi:hypothetical protein